MLPATSIKLRRHYRELSSEEMEEVAKTMASLIVEFIKKHREVSSSKPARKNRSQSVRGGQK